MLSAKALLERPLWVFDMDGTLTVPQHDFAAFKAANGLPADLDVLAGIATLDEGRAREVRQAVSDWEDDLAAHAVAQDDAVALLDALVARGAELAVLTRNTRSGAATTLRSSGLDRYFPDPDRILGRHCAAPKPSPEGVQLLLERVGAGPGQAVMVGDWVFDVMAGRHAGTGTVLVARHGPCPPEWQPFADLVVDRLDELLVD